MGWSKEEEEWGLSEDEPRTRAQIGRQPPNLSCGKMGGNRRRQIKKNVREALTSPAESFEGGREKCRHLDVPFQKARARDIVKDVEGED